MSIAIDDIGCSDSASFIPFFIFDNREEKSQRRTPSLLFGPFQNLFISWKNQVPAAGSKLVSSRLMCGPRVLFVGAVAPAWPSCCELWSSILDGM